ncbi:MAG: OsmC family protein [Candidatus Cloacimonetes bacterium]|nr:OsmC family protein [Candidatus Cloacimonadota bacterium]
MAEIQLKWQKGMAFEVEQDNHKFMLDTEPASGGKALGVRPKALLLSALAGCTGMDVVSILKKMKIEDYNLRIHVEGDSTEDHPKIYHTIRVNYFFSGNDLPEDKLRRAVELSETKYCGVMAMLRKSADISTIINIEKGV